jgi:hypothetical protein
MGEWVMKRRGIGPAVRLGFLIVWLALTCGIAFVVARHESRGTAGDAIETVPPIKLSERATTTIAQHTISPVISGDGIVIADGAAFDLSAPIKPADFAYKLLTSPSSVKAMILGGPVGFDCGWLGIEQGGAGGMEMRCRIPASVHVVAGLSGTMVLAMSKPVDAMSLPVTAVVGGASQGQVIVIDSSGKTSRRDVGLGISDTFWIEITSGLGAGERVLANPVQGDFAGAGR